MIWIFHGPIASGKSTQAARMADRGTLIANDDAIVSMVHGGDYGLYSPQLKPLYKGIRNSMIQYAAATNRDIVIDSTALTRETRRGILAMGKSLDMLVGLMLFRNGHFAGEADGIRRYESDPRGHTRDYWINVAKSHKLNHDPVTAEELRLYDEVQHVGWYDSRP